MIGGGRFRAAAAGLLLAAGAAAAAGPASARQDAARPAAAPTTFGGLLQAEAEIRLHCPGPGLVASVPLREGDPVDQGQPVVVLDATVADIDVELAKGDLEAAEITLRKVKDPVRPEDLERAEAFHREAKAGLELAERTLRSDLELHAAGILSELSRQRSERGVDAARAAAESRRLDLVLLQKGARPEDVRLAALEVERRRHALALRERDAARHRIGPSREGRGVVARTSVEVGQWLQAGTEVATVVYMDRLKVELNLPGPEARGLARGAAVVVSSPAFPGIRLEGRVERIAPVVDPASGTVRVVVAAANPEHALRPGVAATVEFPR